MPRYKLSPEERAAEQAKKKKLLELAQGLDLKDASDFHTLFKDMMSSA